LPVPAQKKAVQRITKSHYKRILKIKRIIDAKYNKYTFSIFCMRFKINIKHAVISISKNEGTSKIRFVFNALQTIHGCGILRKMQMQTTAARLLCPVYSTVSAGKAARRAAK
jgi:hypothetical protein